jgi:N-acetylglucosamine-6-phosphate deacetylase
MRAKGLPDGESELGGQKVYVKNGEARLADGTLAGSVLKMNIALKNVVERVGVPFIKAVDYATINPAKMLGIDNETGSIAVGKRADFTVIDEQYNVLMTIRDGEIIYRA